jgi:hypothetical protein
MRWFRSNRHYGVRLALIAMALQLVLTFGHVHAPQASSPDPAASTDTASLRGSGPHQPAHNGLADVDCPTCALIQLSAMSAPSVAPSLPLPASADFVVLRPHAEWALDASPHFRARARAPPSA